MSKKVLITGCCSFIASHAVEHVMKNTDWSVVGIDKLNYAGIPNRITDLMDFHPEWRERFKFIYFDLQAPITPYIRSELGKINYIWHFAAESHVDDSVKNPVYTIQNNIMCGVNVLEYARSLDSLELVLDHNTDECFGNSEGGLEFEPWDRHKPTNPYSASRSALSQIFTAYANTYQLPAVIVHNSNNFGQRQHVSKFVPLCIKKLLEDDIIDIHCYPGTEKAGYRYYIHARDTSNVLLFLHDNFTNGERYNIPPRIKLSNKEMAERIAYIMGRKPKFNFVDVVSDRPFHDTEYSLKDDFFIKKGFNYTVSFDDSLEKTVRWTLNNMKWLNA